MAGFREMSRESVALQCAREGGRGGGGGVGGEEWGGRSGGGRSGGGGVGGAAAYLEKLGDCV